MAKFTLTSGDDLFPDVDDDGEFQDNSGNDRIRGRGGDDTIDGGEGNDRISGNSGNDFLQSLFGNNRILGGSGDDRIISGEGKDNLSGNSGDDLLEAGDGDDKLNGGSGEDLLYGGAGDDNIKGGKGDDFLDGGLGDDTMKGEKGDDIYFVDSEDDEVIEKNNQGDDLVVSYTESYTLLDHVENLLLDQNDVTGEYGIEGFGNEDDNFIQGNFVANLLEGDDGDDTIEGAEGNDILTGGDGEDSFLYRNFDFSFNRGDFGVDLITDFEDEDKILLDEDTFFFGAPTDIEDEFEIVDDIDDAKDSDFLIVYNEDNGVIYYNENRDDPGFADDSRSGGPFIVLQDIPDIDEDNFETGFFFDFNGF